MSTEPAKIPSTNTENVKLDGNLISVKRYVVFGFATLFVLVGGLGGLAGQQRQGGGNQERRGERFHRGNLSLLDLTER